MADEPLVAVTGASGFIGRVLVQRLLDTGAAVTVLSRRPQAEPPFDAPSVKVHVGNVLQPDTLSAWLEGVTTVYHLAGAYGQPAGLADVNVQGTVNVVEASRAAGVSSFVYLSSVGVIGADGSARVVDERTPPRPANEYERSKLAAEERVLSSNGPRLAASALRPPIVYGDGKRPGRDSFVRLMKLIRDGRFAMLGDAYLSSYVYVGDVAAACQALAGSPGASGRAFIVSEPIPLQRFLSEAASILRVARPKMLPRPLGRFVAWSLRRAGRFGSLYNQTVYRGEALSAVGFRLPFGYQSGLRRTLAWYEQRGLL